MNYYLSQLSAPHSDYHFDSFFPKRIRDLSDRHWTPHSIAKEAADFLANKPGVRILDIGSGIGKFCLVGAHYHPENVFYGVEQRSELLSLSNDARRYYQLENVSFIPGNFTDLNLGDYDNFYFYNSFLENLDPTDLIDDLPRSFSLYSYYHSYLFGELKKMPMGTRVVTFDTNVSQIPSEFSLKKISTGLKMWIKTK